MELELKQAYFRDSILHCAAEIEAFNKAIGILNTQLQELLLLCCPVKTGDVIIITSGVGKGRKALIGDVKPELHTGRIRAGVASFEIFAFLQLPNGEWAKQDFKVHQTFDIVSKAADEAVSEG